VKQDHSELELYQEKTYLSYQIIARLPAVIVADCLRAMMASPEDELAAMAARSMAQYFMETDDEIAACIEDFVADFDSKK